MITTNTDIDLKCLQAIIEKSDEGILIVDKNRIIKYMNSAASSILSNNNHITVPGDRFNHTLEEEESYEVESRRKTFFQKVKDYFKEENK